MAQVSFDGTARLVTIGYDGLITTGPEALGGGITFFGDAGSELGANIRDLGDKVSAEAKAKVEEKRTKLNEARQNADFDSLKPLFDELQQELYALGASVYQQAGADGASSEAAAGASSNDGGDDVIDAEFTETK